MGHDVYRSVKKHALAGLTHREKLVAMVLADDADEKTWITWNSPYDAAIMEMCMIKTDREMRRVLGVLLNEKVIEKHEGGHNGKVLKFRFLDLSDEVDGRKTPPYADGSGDEPAGPSTEKSPPTDGVGGRNPPSRRAKKAPPTPQTPQPPTSHESRGSQEEQATGRAGGGDASLQQQTAHDMLARIISRHSRLALGEKEITKLVPLVVPWLERASESQLEQALTAGLPMQIGNPAGLVRTRLTDKLPPIRSEEPGEPRCNNPDCDPVTHMVTLPNGDIDFCSICHKTGRARARRQNGTRP